MVEKGYVCLVALIEIITDKSDKDYYKFSTSSFL